VFNRQRLNVEYWTDYDAVGALDPRDAEPGLASFEVGDYRANPAVVVVSGRKVQLGQNVADVLLDGGFGEL